MPPSIPPSSVEARAHLIKALHLDLIGPAPGPDAQHADEVLDQAPSRFYLSGFLVPFGPSREGDDLPEQLDQLDQAGRAGSEEQSGPEQPSARRVLLPSSMGLSFLLPESTDSLEVTVSWGDYLPLATPEPEGDAAERYPCWRRTPRQASLTLTLPAAGSGAPGAPIWVPGSGGLELATAIRPVAPGGRVPPKTRSVSVFLVNRRPKDPDEALRDRGYAFQATLQLRASAPLQPRPDPRGHDSDSWDEQVADLQYRDHHEYAAGHNVSAQAILDPDGHCREIRTTWLPQAEVEKVVPGEVPDVELSMETLGAAASADEVRRLTGALLTTYDAWIAARLASLPEEPGRRQIAQDLQHAASRASARIAAGLDALRDDPQVFAAFCLANRAVATALRQRAAQLQGQAPDTVDAPRWRPFQLAFLLMNLHGLADPAHPDRERVDLLFFPTGGGKTEAYLGLAAFTLVLRRLRHLTSGHGGAGVSVLMRYTLRLLTLDQLDRAATLICALERLRQGDPARLGSWPFEIGLFVGQGATPNRLGKKGESDEHSARARTLAFQSDDRRHPAPIPIECCPWCGTKFSTSSFELSPTPDAPLDLRVRCASRRCAFNRDPLPILAVDAPIYRRLPCFVIATVDKFAGLPWVGETGALFGKVQRHDKDGFYGPCAPGRGKPLPESGGLPPPDLIIQDELHLISGPLGTMAGLYEAAIDALCARGAEGGRPKIIASTATVRRAERQIRALFGRTEVEIFPPPGPDHRDSFFARTVPVSEKPARLYLGVSAQGRSPKVMLLRVYLALLGAAQRAWQEAGGAKVADNPADPYMTLLGYFNSLRELGGSRRIVEDEVNARLGSYAARRRVGEGRGLFGDRTISDVPLELTSRVATNEVSEAKRRLRLPFLDKERVDVALATNMISVGLDITRLGLMVVLGQPKTAAEYIQATSRVGRDERRPGLVVTLLNVHRPRDRSHYERFAAWHQAFYRAVEATSVTPFSPRAIDRGIAAVAVALARHGYQPLTAPVRAADMPLHRDKVEFVAEVISRRAEGHDKELGEEGDVLRQKVKRRVNDILDAWEKIAHERGQGASGLQYGSEVGGEPPLLHEPMERGLSTLPAAERKFKAPRSLRDVEPAVNLWVRNPDGRSVSEAEDEP